MKLNESIAISTPRVLLVPYEPLHVERYYRWMQDQALREATASEALSPEEELENQHSWRASHDKLTFILCRPVTDFSGGGGDDGFPTATHVCSGAEDAPDRMLGDVNLFIHRILPDDEAYHDGDGDGDGNGPQPPPAGVHVAEINLMVAEEQNRGKGVGEAAVKALLGYVHRHVREIMAEYAGGEGKKERGGRGEGEVGGGEEAGYILKGFAAKIDSRNTKSLALFRRLGFAEKGGPNYFGEVEMVLDGRERAAADGMPGYREIEYRR